MISETLTKEVLTHFACTELTPAYCRTIKYPKLLPVMHFTVHQYRCPFGNLMTMDTNAMFGKMQLSTIVFTPDTGKNLPVLLIDSMDMKDKHLMYAEYYDCTAAGAGLPGARTQREEYAGLPDYAEKPGWYIARRMPCSLIKGGAGCSPGELQKMALVCVQRYLAAAENAGTDPANLAVLGKFQEDMWTLGNPSAGTMTKVLGKKKAEEFFRTVVMPVQAEEDYTVS